MTKRKAKRMKTMKAWAPVDKRRNILEDRTFSGDEFPEVYTKRSGVVWASSYDKEAGDRIARVEIREVTKSSGHGE